MRRCAEHLFPLPFLPGMAATFADYLGMAMLTPALPYWCADEAGMTPARVATWTGAITTAQYAGAAMGNFAVGAAGDGLGAKRTLLATLLGDVALFTLTAVETRPGALLAIRLVAPIAFCLLRENLAVGARQVGGEGSEPPPKVYTNSFRQPYGRCKH